MLNYLASRSTLLLLNRGLIKNDQKDVYVYGFSLFYSTFFTAAMILLQAALLQNVLIGIIFICFFALPRFFVGGYHASSYAKCFVISNLLFFLTFLLSCMSNYLIINVIKTLFYILSLTYLYMYSKKKPSIKKTFQKLLSLECIICVLLLIIPISSVYISVAMISTTIVVLLHFNLKPKKQFGK